MTPCPFCQSCAVTCQMKKNKSAVFPKLAIHCRECKAIGPEVAIQGQNFTTLDIEMAWTLWERRKINNYGEK